MADAEHTGAGPGREPGSGHAHAHGHAHGPAPAIAVPRGARWTLLAVLALVAVATVVGVVSLWPDHAAVDRIQRHAAYAAPGVTFPDAEVVSVARTCPAAQAEEETTGTGSSCDTLGVRIDSGADRGRTVTVQAPHEVMTAGVPTGATVQVLRSPPAGGRAASYTFVTLDRGAPLGWLALGFALLVLLVARLRGLMALVSLALGGVAVWIFTLPALLTGESGTAVAVVSAAAIMYVVLYATHGVSLRTSAALAGTLAGVGVTALLGLLVIDRGHLTGVADETGGFLSTATTGLDFRGLLAAGIVIAGLGVLNDVTITQASAVWELRAAGPTLPRRTVFASAMRIGRDHIASTIYTIVFAYAGTALITLLLLSVYDRPLISLLSTEDLAEEVARTLTSAIGLVLAVPLTTAVAALVAAPRTGDPTTAVSPGPRTAGRRRAEPRRRWRRSPDWDLEADRADRGGRVGRVARGPDTRPPG